MEEKKDPSDPMVVDEEFYQLIGDVTEIPYSALPLEQLQIFFIAESIETLIGYSAAEIYADRQLWINIIHPDDRERVLAAFTKCKNEGTEFEVEYRISHKDGSLCCVNHKGAPVFNDKGEIIEIEGIITDVSERRKPEEPVSSKA